MYYSLIGLLALATLVIINYDVLLKREESTKSGVQQIYRRFLYGIILYYITDIIWGLLEYLSQTRLLFYDTEVYFIVLALGVMFWTQYVIAYLDQQNAFRKYLFYAGRAFFIIVTALTLINLVYPVMFWFDEDGLYHTSPIRNTVLITQILLLLSMVVYSLYTSSKSEGKIKSRHFTIGFSGLIMLFFISIQIFFPYLPLYCIAYMMGSCLLRSFIVEYEKEDYRKKLETALQNEKQHIIELNFAKKVANTDSLTGVKSKSAYADYIKDLQDRMDKRERLSFAIGMFDCDDLKLINDRYGHEKGDEYLKTAARLICRIFHHSPVFRIGGDEFAVVLTNDDYENREELISRFEMSRLEICAMAKNEWEQVSVALGIAAYDPEIDYSVDDVFKRADQEMYEDKRIRKAYML